MKQVYSTYEAKAKFSALLRAVRRGIEVVITHHGEPIALLSAYQPESGNLESRLSELSRVGALDLKENQGFPSGVKRSGALARFLDDRDES